MTDNEINIAIAEELDYEWRYGIYKNCRGLFHKDDNYLKDWVCEDMSVPIACDCATRIPDYVNDLNAMHKAEDLLNVPQLEAYTDMIGVRSTARERAEALLRTIGKWKE